MTDADAHAHRIEVADNPAEARYEIRSDGALVGLIDYRLADGRITFVHTEVEDAYSGQGLGHRLVAGALDDVRARGLELVPRCPFVSAFIREHQDAYLDLVLPSLRSQVTDGGGDG